MATRFQLCFLGLLGVNLFASPVAAQVFFSGPSDPAGFTTVINLPPSPNISSSFTNQASVGSDGVLSQLNILDGGSVGSFFNSNFGSEVNISGGSTGIAFDANSGSEVNISGGNIGSFFDANSGSLVNISGGTFGNGFNANFGSVVNISGGVFGSFNVNFATADSIGPRVNISGGTFGDDFSAGIGSEVNISGGTFGDGFFGRIASDINLFGSNFVLNDMPIDDSLTIGNAFTIVDRGVSGTLEGQLADGSAFSFDLESNFDPPDFFGNGTLTVTLVSSVPEPGSLVLLGIGGAILLARRRKSNC